MPRLVIECDDNQATEIQAALTHMSGVRVISVTPTTPTWCATPDQPTVHPVQTPTDHTPLSIYTDGACKGNPGPTGMAIVLHDGPTPTEAHAWGGGEHVNNAAELAAVISALNYAALRRAHHVTITTDSDYVGTNAARWQPRWMAGTLHAVGNPQLWAALFQVKTALEAVGTTVEIRIVRAHSGDPHNELADRLASKACKRPTYHSENYNYGAPALRIQQPA